MHTDSAIEKKCWLSRVIRKLFYHVPSSFLVNQKSWRWLRFYPAVIPAPYCFSQWNEAVKSHIYQNYQLWINQNSLSGLKEWRLLQQESFHWLLPPKISLVTPVHNTEVDVLYECIISIRAQAYPYWQLILVDDGSSSRETRQLLRSAVCKDPRIQVYFSQQSQGISYATNLAIDKAEGDYIVFLDHDDRLALDALYWIAKEIKNDPSVDIIYSDRDMISPKGERYMFLFKPRWSPETLLAGNYIFHLMCYRQSLVAQLGGLRAEFDGSQDYDLILRAAETKPCVRHIQKVLYHWRQYEGSVALDSGAKDYAFEAGIKALNEALQRRGIVGCASEIKSLWRGNYQLSLIEPPESDIDILRLDAQSFDNYTQSINQFIQNSEKTYIAVMSAALGEQASRQVSELAAWLQIEGVALASGRLVTENQLLDYAGATYQPDGRLIIPYQGLPMIEPSYMAVMQLTRNISAPHPHCVVIRRDVWQALGGLKPEYQGFYGLLDFSLSALAADWRCVSVPQVTFVTTEPNALAMYAEEDQKLFFHSWQSWLDKGDPYYNSNLVRTCQDKPYHLPA